MKKHLILLLLTFSTVILFGQELQWKEGLSNMHLSRISSENTLSSDYSTSSQVYLCANGYFYMSVIDNYSKSEFEGVWMVEEKPVTTEATVTVQFNDGDIAYYKVVFYNNRLFIDGDEFQYETTYECD